MDYRLSDDERMVRRATAELVRDAIAPAAAETDRSGVVPDGIRRSLGELGYFGAGVPVEMGGAGMGTTSLVLAIAEVARGCASTALLLVASNCLVVEALLRAGAPDQKSTLLPRLASGASLGAGCLAEPDAGLEPAAPRTTATPSAAGLILTGRKNPAPAVALADILLLTAGLDRAGHGPGPAVLVLERGICGVEVGPALSLLGQRACAAASVSLDRAEVPGPALLAHGQAAVDLIDHLTATFNLGLAAAALGVAEAASASALRYSRERRQFGHPICDFGAIRAMVAQSAAEIEAVRHLTLRASAECEAGRPFALLAGQARLLAGQTANRVADRALQVHGGYGYIKDYDVERHFRDARLFELWAPASEQVTDDIATRLLGAGEAAAARG